MPQLAQIAGVDGTMGGQLLDRGAPPAPAASEASISGGQGGHEIGDGKQRFVLRDPAHPPTHPLQSGPLNVMGVLIESALVKLRSG